MRILFIITRDDDQDKYIFRLKPNEGIYIPLGVAQIAAIIEERSHEVKVLDLRVEKGDTDNIMRRTVSAFKPEFIGLPISYFSSKIVYRIAGLLKRLIDCPIVLGGSYVTVFGKSILEEHKEIDILVIGEGDYTFAEIADGKKLDKINGIIFRAQDGSIITTSKRIELQDMDKLPYPAMHLFKVDRYIPLPKNYRRTPILPVITSRGCSWGRCRFCFQPGKFRRNSPEYIVELISDYKKRFKVREIRFWDDTFIDNTDWVLRFCSLMKKRRLNILWSCHARVNLVSKKVLSSMKDAGCWQIMYGIESGSQELLDRINKGITLKQAKMAVKWAKEVGLEVRNSFMLGLPGETPELADKTIKFARSLKADITQFSFTTPYPGTRLYEELKDSPGLEKDISEFCEYKAVYVPRGYRSKIELEKKLRKAYRKLFFNPGFILRSISNIRSFDDLRKYYNGLKVAVGMAYKK